MATATINGFEMHYQVLGEGPAVVWLHGLMGSMEAQERLFAGLEGLDERGFRAISYDARGHGESGYTEEEAHYSWQAHAGDMGALMDHLGIERAHIGGGSMGAGVSLAFALAHPQRVEKLVLVAPPPLADTIGPVAQLFGAFASLVEALGLEQAVELAMRLPQFAQLKETEPEQYELLRDWLLSQRPRAVVFAIRGLLNGPPLPEERFAEIRAPTLIVGHPDDPLHPQSSAERLHAAIAGSRLIMAPEATYFREHRDEVMEAVAAFLRGEGAAKQEGIIRAGG